MADRGAPEGARRAAASALAAALLFAFPTSALAETLEERAAVCLACHGGGGQPVPPETPLLGAQPAIYTLIQLFMYRGKLRTNEIMNDAVKDFTDDDLRAFSEFLSKLPPPVPTNEVDDQTRFERGKMLSARHRCDFCHNADLSGRENIPRIAGQREDYLVKMMRDYKSNTRPGYDASMAEVMQPVTDREIEDLGYYAARRR